MLGKEYSSSEIRYIPMNDLVKGNEYLCKIPSDANVRSATLVWNGNVFTGHINGDKRHVDEGRRIGTTYPIAERKA